MYHVKITHQKHENKKLNNQSINYTKTNLHNKNSYNFGINYTVDNKDIQA